MDWQELYHTYRGGRVAHSLLAAKCCSLLLQQTQYTAVHELCKMAACTPMK